MKHHRFLTAVVATILGVSGASAEPYFAAWKGMNCNACHVNQTGGFLRTDFGKNYGNALQTFDWEGISEAADTISHAKPTWVSVGLDVHAGYSASFFSSPGINSHRFLDDIGGRKSLSVQARANEVISGVITFRPGFNGEIYGLISGLPSGAYLKMGSFTVPYGLQLADDASLVRNLIGFNFDTVSNGRGVEAGIYPGNFFLNAALTEGSSPHKIITSRGGIQFPEFALGGTVYGENLGLFERKVRYGIYGWGRLGPVVVLGEYDQGYDQYSPSVPPPRGGNRFDFRAYHASLELDLGRSSYLRVGSELLDQEVFIGPYDGFRHILGFRCYPMRNLKAQVDVARFDPLSSLTLGSGEPYYTLLVDAFFFY